MADWAPTFTYEQIIDASERVSWRIDDLMPPGTKLRFDRPHLPDVLAETAHLTCLDERGRLKLNHIRGHSYMNLFAFVEEYIIAQSLQHAEAEMFGDKQAIRALLRFCEEEVKHQALFLRYCAAFREGFGTPCNVLGAAADVAAVILAKSPMAVMLTTLQLELMTQKHYVGAVKDDSSLDPLFANILKHHWLEEAQHAKIDVLELVKLAADMPEKAVDVAFEDYFGILTAFDGLLVKQAEMDLESLCEATGRRPSDADRSTILKSQLHSYRKDFLVMGMANPLFIQTARGLSPRVADRLSAETARYAASE
jgi:hypothetical protein